MVDTTSERSERGVVSRGVEALLPRIVEVMNVAGVPFMIAGSFATMAHGATTDAHDLDIVIDPTPASLDRLLSSLPASSYHVDAKGAHEALRTHGLFHVVDLATAWGIDFIVLKDRAFSREELKRRVTMRLHGVDVFVASAEDTLLAELEWSHNEGGSETQRRNARGILTNAKVDLAYVERWVGELGLVNEWALVRDEAAKSMRSP